MTNLTSKFCHEVERPGCYGAGLGGGGLSLLVRRGAKGGISKFWTQRIRFERKPINVGLGAFPNVSVKEARAKAFANKARADAGRDPRRALTRGRFAASVPASVLSSAPTFEEAAETVIGLHKPNWRNGGKSAGQWRASLRDYCGPLRRKPVDEITSADIMACLVPHWSTKHETMRRVKQRLGVILDWAVAQGHRTDNPVAAVSAALPKVKAAKTSHLALPWKEVAGAVKTIRESDALDATKLLFEFVVLTGARSGEARGATWREIDMKGAVWTIPAKRMKAGKEHRVPLSKAALAVLAEAWKARTLHCFASPSKKPLSDNTLSKLLRENGVKAVPHGFRSSLRDWAAESGYPRDVAEAALAHTVQGVEGAYFRSDLLDRRRELMEEWAKVVYK